MRFLIVNPTCLSLLDRHRPWLQSLGVEAVVGAADVGPVATGAQECVSWLEGIDAVIGPGPGLLQFSAAVEQGIGRLKAISLASSGYDWVDLLSATQHGIVVTHTPIDSLGEVVADLTWGLLLAVARLISDHHLRLQRGNTDRVMGAMVWGKTLGVVGLGNIGQKVVRRAAGFEMRVVAAERCPDRDFCAQHAIAILDLDDLLRQSDFVTLHLRLDDTTEGIIGARELGLMKPGAYLINTARAGLVDHNALVQAVMTRRIAGAALDDAPQGATRSLLNLPNVVFTPHIGNRVLESADAVCRQAYVNALDVVQGRIPESRYVLNREVFRHPSPVASSARFRISRMADGRQSPG